jgi:hypothetical protein
MDVDEDDDFYSPEEPAQSTEQTHQTTQQPQPTNTKVEQEDEDLEEGEEEDEGSEGSDSVCSHAGAPWAPADNECRISTSSQRGKTAQLLLPPRKLFHLAPISFTNALTVNRGIMTFETFPREVLLAR